MSTRYKFLAAIVLAVCTAGLLLSHMHNLSIPVLQPRGPIAHKERNLIFIALGLCMIVVVPVYAMLFGFAWKYREGNTKAKYRPDFDHSRLFESVWWGVPIIIISILGVITWRSSQDLDPFKPISSVAPSIDIQVVSLQWRWLFIYPKQNIASLNYFQIPLNTPVNFEITSDAPMNSFWVPQLGGQIYAMSGMSTRLNLEANQPGKYYGSSANISGDGFADMHFVAEATSQKNFNSWVSAAQKTPTFLSSEAYSTLSKPSHDRATSYYYPVEPGLYGRVVAKYLPPIYQDTAGGSL